MLGSVQAQITIRPLVALRHEDFLLASPLHLALVDLQRFQPTQYYPEFDLACL
jgi:hypothetical protein